MNILLSPSRRQAERFADLLEGPAPASRDHRFDDALATVASMRAVADSGPAPRADFVADLRSRLMVEADTALVPTDQRLLLPARSTSGRRQGRAAAAVAALVIVGGSAGISVAAQSSLPGESLYPVKRGIENTHEALSFSDAAQGRALLGQATARLGEVRSLDARGSTSEASLTLDKFTSSAGAGADLLFRDYQSHPDVAGVTAVRDFTGTAMGDLDALSAEAPASMRPALVAAAQLLADLDQQARVLCADCGARSPLSAPSDLLLTSAPSLDQLLVDPSAGAPTTAGASAGAPTTSAPSSTVTIPDVGGTLAAAAGSPTTTTPGSAASSAAPAKKPSAALPPSLPSTVTTVTDGLGQVVTGTVDGLTSTVTGLTNLTGLTPTP